jgi:hypothetical protein
MKTCFRIVILLSMVLELCALPQSTATAQTSADGSAMPAGLQEAFLAASAKPFSTQGGTYTTEYKGLGYRLNVEGLKGNLPARFGTRGSGTRGSNA